MDQAFNHFDATGNAIMADVSGKAVTHRVAVAVGRIRVSPPVMDAIMNGAVKGDVLNIARIAGIQATKRTAELIPLCHPLALTRCAVDFEPDVASGCVHARCTAETDGITGVEMEALCGVSAALLTIYDMCKGVDRSMVIEEIHLLQKSGGRSGDFRFGGAAHA